MKLIFLPISWNQKDKLIFAKEVFNIIKKRSMSKEYRRVQDGRNFMFLYIRRIIW